VDIQAAESDPYREDFPSNLRAESSAVRS
jgi:hypothetical protein